MRSGTHRFVRRAPYGMNVALMPGAEMVYFVKASAAATPASAAEASAYRLEENFILGLWECVKFKV